MDFLLGEHLTAITVTPLTKNGDGTYSPGASQSIAGYILEVDATKEVTNEDIRPVNLTQRNEVPTSKGHTLRVMCLGRSAAEDVMTSLVHTPYYFFQFDWVEAGRNRQFSGSLGRHNFGIKNRGGNPVGGDFAPIARNGSADNLTIS